MMQSLTRRRIKLIKSFCRGPGGSFFKKRPLAAGGKFVLASIAFSHMGYTLPVQMDTTVTAYRGDEKKEVTLESGDIW